MKDALLKIIMPILVVVLGGYTGYGEWEKRQVTPTVTVNIESKSQSPHPDVEAIVLRALNKHKVEYH